jgi:hypothetical protein
MKLGKEVSPDADELQVLLPAFIIGLNANFLLGTFALTS